MTKLLGALCALGLLFTLACGDHCPPCVPIDAPAQGFVSARWAIVGDTNQLETCALVGAASVALTLHPRNRGPDITLTSACPASSPASYAVSVGASGC